MCVIRVQAVMPCLLALARVGHGNLVEIGLLAAVHAEALCEGLNGDDACCSRGCTVGGGKGLGKRLGVDLTEGLSHD